jgi:uncharacterized protein DUF1653
VSRGTCDRFPRCPAKGRLLARRCVPGHEVHRPPRWPASSFASDEPPGKPRRPTRRAAFMLTHVSPGTPVTGPSTHEELVVYRQEYGDHGLWVRPKAMFMDSVVVNGQVQPRFQYLQPD